MLDLAVAIQKLRSHHADVRPLRVLQHRIQPVFLRYFHIVVHEQEVVALCDLGGAVVEGRQLKVPGMLTILSACCGSQAFQATFDSGMLSMTMISKFRYAVFARNDVMTVSM